MATIEKEGTHPAAPGWISTLRRRLVACSSAEVMAIGPSKSRPNRGFMDLRVTTRNAAGDTLVTQSWRLVVPSGSAASA